MPQISVPAYGRKRYGNTKPTRRARRGGKTKKSPKPKMTQPMNTIVIIGRAYNDFQAFSAVRVDRRESTAEAILLYLRPVRVKQHVLQKFHFAQ
jgi:hypothetical protein